MFTQGVIVDVCLGWKPAFCVSTCDDKIANVWMCPLLFEPLKIYSRKVGISQAVPNFVKRIFDIRVIGDLIRKGQRVVWLGRYRLKFLTYRFLSRKSAAHSPWRGLSNIACVYINLDERLDRRSEVQEELAELEIESPVRKAGIRRTPGILGCTLSHAAALDSMRSESGIVMICEDDVEFVGDSREIGLVVEEFSSNPLLDVLCLAYNLGAKPHRISEALAITSDTQTASCYLVKPHAIDPLVEIFQKGASMLEKGVPAWAAANDVIWKRLQRGRLIFAIPHKPLARQRPSFSDVEGKWVDYGV